MKIKIFRDLSNYTVTSSITVEDIRLVKKYKPAALKKKDADGNDLFAISYSEGNSSISKAGITFGKAAAEDGCAMVIRTLPEKFDGGVTAKDYVADEVGCITTYLKEFEAVIPAIVAEIKATKAALVGEITEA